MTYPFSRLAVSIQAASGDGLYYGRFPHGDAPPAGAIITGAALTGITAGAGLQTQIRLGGAAGDLSSANAGLTTGSGGGGVFTPDFFISPTGSDSNNGLTAGTAWAITSLQSTNSNNSKMAGKKVQIQNGTHDCTTVASHAFGNDFSFPCLSIPAGPNTSTPTIVRAQTKQLAILDFTGNPAVNSMIGQDPTGTGCITIDGLKVTGGGTCQMSPIDLRYGSSNIPGIRIQNCDLGNFTHISDGGNSAVILLQDLLSPVVTNCILHDLIKTGTQPDHAHAITCFSVTGGQFTFNTINGTFNGIDGKTNSSGCLIAYNYFTNLANKIAIHGMDGAEGNPNGGTNSAGLNTNIFHHNVFDDCGVVHAGDVNQTGSTQNITGYNNTVYLSSGSGSGQSDMRTLAVTGDTPLASFYNNIMVRTTGTGLIGTDPRVGTWDYNAYALATTTNAWLFNGSNISSFATWKSSSGLDANGVFSASPTFPQFVATIVPGSGAAQFALGASSPLRAAGSNPGRVGGVSSGAAIDMGAWGFDPALGGPPTQIGAI